MEEKILGLYACGMSQRDISEQIKNLYDVDISPELVSKISEKIMPEVTAWQNRPLEAVYPFVFLDAIHYKVKENHQYQTKAAYVVLGITMDGTKDILGVWIGEYESSKFWLNVLNDLKSRGVLDVYLFCVDGLKGLAGQIGNHLLEQSMQTEPEDDNDVVSAAVAVDVGADNLIQKPLPTENGIQVSVGLDNLAQLYLIGLAIVIVAVSTSSITVMRLKPREILSKMS